jgi:ATP-binding cassette subfamily G (WHITE) protein 2 (SNQ2)
MINIFEPRGDQTRSFGVMFKDLKVVGLGGSVSYQPTLGSVLNPLNIIGAIDAFRHPPVKDILAGFEGVVLPGEMLREFFSVKNLVSWLIKML